MPIPNITRTNTVDEWRIQTNLSANALNRLETGNYDKTAGSLNIACTAVLSITSTGTGLSVANNALVSGDFTVGKGIALGSEGAATGNLTVGANTYIYGKGAALFVANSAIVNVSLQATQSIRTNNIIANTDASITGTAQIGYLTVNNSSTIGTTLDVVGNTTVGNLVTANSVVGDSLRISSDAGIGGTLRVTGNSIFGNVNTANMMYAGSLRTVGRTDIGTTLDVVGNTTVGNLVTSNSVVADNGRFTNNVTVGHIVANSGSIVANNARFNANTSVGEELTTVTINTTNARIAANANVAHLTASGSLVADSARIAANATFGETTATTINATNARVSGNANVAHLTATGSLVADSARISANATFAETTATTINATNARISGNANVAHLTATGSLVADSARISANATFRETTATTINTTNARISGNANVAHLTASGSTVADSLRITNDAGIGGTLRVTGNSVFGNVNTANMLYAGTLVTSGRADIGGSLDVDGDAIVGGKLTVSGDFVLTGDIVYDTDVLTVSTVTPVTTTGAGYYGVFRGNTTGGINGANVNALGTVSDANAYIRWSASANTWQIRDVFNPNPVTSYSKVLTANLINSSVTSTSSDTFLSSAGANTLNNSIITVNTRVSTEITDRQANVGAGLIFVTNAYQANVGQLRLDTSNANTSLAANIGAARISDAATSQANVGAGLITVTNNYQANVGALRIDTVTANTNLKNYVDVANTNLKNYTDSTFLKLSGVTQSISSDVSITGNLTVTGTTTYLNTTELNVSDNEITLNSDWPTTAVPTQNAGITVHRGLHPNVYVRYDETNDYWVLRDNVAQYIIATTANVGAIGIAVTNAYQANVGAARITDQAAAQANTGAGLISVTSAYQANVGAARIGDKALWEANSGVALISAKSYTDTANTNMKNYVDTRSTTNISEGTNLYYTDARARAAVSASGSLSYNSSTGVFSYTTPSTSGISEGTNLYYTDARVRAAVGTSATFAAPLNYISSNGTFQHLNSGVTATGYGSSVNIPVFNVNATGHVTSVTNTAIRTATTSQTGIVQLENSVSSTSTTTASVPAAVKVAYDYAQAAFTAANTVTTGSSANPQFNSLGVGTAASGSAGDVRATGDITAYYSDDRLKNREKNIDNALQKISTLNGFYYRPNEIAQQLGYPDKRDVGVSAQEVQDIIPEIVVPAPIDDNYLTVHYHKLVPLLIEAIKELKAEIEELKKK